MKQKELVTLLKVLSAPEIKQLQTYASTFHQGSQAIGLLESLCRKHPNFLEKKIEEETVWRTAYPQESFHQRKHDRLISNLYEIVKEFAALLIIRRKDKKATIEKEKLFAQMLREKELYDEYEKSLAKQEKLIEQNTKTDIWSKKELIPLYHKRYFNAKIRRDKGGQILQELIENLDHFYFNYRSLLEIEIVQRKTVLDEKIKFSSFEEAVSKFVNSRTSKNVLIKCIEPFFNKEIYSSDSAYNALQATVIKFVSKLQEEDKVTVLNYLLNITAFHLNKGKSHFLPISFKIFKYIDKNRFFIVDDVIPDVFFTNAIDTACKVSEVKWASDFFERNQKYLPQNKKTEVIKFTKAILAFEQGQYDIANNCLRTSNFTTPQHSFRQRLLFIKIDFEFNDFEGFHNECKRLQRFLKKTTPLHPKTINGAENFIRISTSLFNITGQKDELFKISQDIRTSENLHEKAWLLRKLQMKGGVVYQE